VQYLSGYMTPDGKPILTRFDFPYKQTTIQYFTPYRDHPAVRLFTKMSAEGFSFGMPPEAMLSLSNPPELKIVRPFSDLVLKRAGGRKQLEQFISELRNFARDSGFMDFYRFQKPVYAEMTGAYRLKMQRWETAADIEEYFGWKQAGYHIILSPFFHPGGFGPRIPRAKDVFDVYNLSGPYRLTDGRPDFGSEAEIRYLIWHEFGHSFINHLTEAHLAELMAPVTKIMPPIPEEALKRAGVDRPVVVSEWVSEHVIRSVTVRLACLKQGAEAGDSALKREMERGYPYVEALCRSLQEYESRRNEYPTFQEYYPEIVRVFTEAAKEKGEIAGN
jgi:hypothetical protein